MNKIINDLTTFRNITNINCDENSLNEQYLFIKKILKNQNITNENILHLLNSFPFIINNIIIDYPFFFKKHKDIYYKNFYALIYTKKEYFDFNEFLKTYPYPPKAYFNIFYNKLSRLNDKVKFIETYPEFLESEKKPDFLNKNILQKIINKTNNSIIFFNNLDHLDKHFIKKFLIENKSSIPKYYSINDEFDIEIIGYFLQTLILKIDYKNFILNISLFKNNDRLSDEYAYLIQFLSKIKDNSIFIQEIEKNFFLANLFPELTSLSAKMKSFNLLLDQLIKLSKTNQIDSIKNLNCFTNFSKTSLLFLKEKKNDHFFILNCISKLKQIDVLISKEEFLMIKNILLDSNDAILINNILKEKSIYNI